MDYWVPPPVRCIGIPTKGGWHPIITIGCHLRPVVYDGFSKQRAWVLTVPGVVKIIRNPNVSS